MMIYKLNDEIAKFLLDNLTFHTENGIIKATQKYDLIKGGSHIGKVPVLKLINEEGKRPFYRHYWTTPEEAKKVIAENRKLAAELKAKGINVPEYQKSKTYKKVIGSKKHGDYLNQKKNEITSQKKELDNKKNQLVSAINGDPALLTAEQKDFIKTIMDENFDKTWSPGNYMGDVTKDRIVKEVLDKGKPFKGIDQTKLSKYVERYFDKEKSKLDGKLQENKAHLDAHTKASSEIDNQTKPLLDKIETLEGKQEALKTQKKDNEKRLKEIEDRGNAILKEYSERTFTPDEVKQYNEELAKLDNEYQAIEQENKDLTKQIEDYQRDINDLDAQISTLEDGADEVEEYEDEGETPTPQPQEETDTADSEQSDSSDTADNGEQGDEAQKTADKVEKLSKEFSAKLAERDKMINDLDELMNGKEYKSIVEKGKKALSHADYLEAKKDWEVFMKTKELPLDQKLHSAEKYLIELRKQIKSLDKNWKEPDNDIIGDNIGEPPVFDPDDIPFKPPKPMSKEDEHKLMMEVLQSAAGQAKNLSGDNQGALLNALTTGKAGQAFQDEVLTPFKAHPEHLADPVARANVIGKFLMSGGGLEKAFPKWRDIRDRELRRQYNRDPRQAQQPGAISTLIRSIFDFLSRIVDFIFGGSNSNPPKPKNP